MARSLAVAVMAAVAAAVTPGTEFSRWSIGLAALVISYNAALSVLLARGALKPVRWIGVSLDTLAFGAAWWSITVAQARSVISIDLYVLMAFPAVLVGLWRLGWATGLVLLAASAGWVAWATARYFPADSDLVAQLLWRLAFLVVTTLVAMRLVAHLATERRRAERLERENDALTQIHRLATDRDNPAASLADIWAAIGEAIPFDRIAIAQIDGPSDTIDEMYVFPGSAGPATRGRLRGTAAEEVVSSGSAVLVDPFRPAANGGPKAGAGGAAAALQSFLCIPIPWQGKVVALLTFAAREDRVYSERHLRLAERVGAMLAPPIVGVISPEAEPGPDVDEDALDQAKRQLVYAIAHHLRTPMTAIQVATDMLEQEVSRAEYPPELRHKVNLLHSGVGRLEILISDALEYVAATQRAAILEKAEVDLAQLLRRVVDSFESTFYSRRQRIMWVQQDEPAPCLADPLHLDRCLIHLVGLASQMTPDGEEITIRLSRSGRSFVAEISTGRWKPRIEELDALFVAQNPMLREPAPAAGTTGMFLGFGIARAIAEAHGGSLEVLKRPDNGAIFRLQIDTPGGRSEAQAAVVSGAAFS